MKLTAHCVPEYLRCEFFTYKCLQIIVYGVFSFRIRTPCIVIDRVMVKEKPGVFLLDNLTFVKIVYNMKLDFTKN